MQTTTQQGLTCYAISAAALMLLDPKIGGTLPDYWFNWQNGNTSRLTFISDSWTQTDIVKWEQNTRNLGHDTHLVLGFEDKWSDGDLFDFSNIDKSVSVDMIISRVRTFSSSKESNTELLDNLREPDVFLMTSFTRLRRGGSTSVTLPTPISPRATGGCWPVNLNAGLA